MADGIAGMAWRLAAPLAEKMGFDLVDTEFVREGSNWYLRIYIDKKGGIRIDDCEAVSRPLSDMLDEAGFISRSYVLEVSSPGLDRPLKTEADFARHEGELLEIRLKPQAGGEKSGGGCLGCGQGGAGESASGGTGGRGAKNAGARSTGGDGEHGRRAQAGARRADSALGRAHGGGKKGGAGGSVARGRLVGLKDGEIRISDEAGNVSAIPLDSAASVKRAVVFD